MEPEETTFPSPVAAPYLSMFPPSSSPHVANTPTRCAQQSVKTPVVNSSPYVRRTLPNRLSSVPRKSPAGQVIKPVSEMPGVALAGPPTCSVADVPIKVERQENSLNFQEIAANSLSNQRNRHEMEDESNVKPHQTADLPLPKPVSGDGLMMPKSDNSTSPVESDVLFENPHKKELIGTFGHSATKLSVKMGVAHTVASPSHSEPIVDVGLTVDLDEETRPSVHQVNIKSKFFLVFPILLILFSIIRSKKLHLRI